MCKMRGGVSDSSARRIIVIDHRLRPTHVSALARVLILSKSNLALPYMDLFNVFRRLMWPSVGPLLHSYANAATTAARSRSIPAARLFISGIRLCDARSIQPGKAAWSLCLRMRLNSRARICASAITGDISTKCSTKARSSDSNFSASRSSSQVVRRAEATIFLPPVLGGGEFGPLRALFNPSGNDALHRATKCLTEDSDPR
jgi:hypothetical protein